MKIFFSVYFFANFVIIDANSFCFFCLFNINLNFFLSFQHQFLNLNLEKKTHEFKKMTSFITKLPFDETDLFRRKQLHQFTAIPTIFHAQCSRRKSVK